MQEQHTVAHKAGVHPTILVVDANEDLLASVRDLLIVTMPEATVLGASKPMAGLQLALAHPPDVVVCAHDASRFDGLDFLSRIRSLAPRAVRILHLETDLGEPTRADLANAGVHVLLDRATVPKRLVPLVLELVASKPHSA